MKKTNKTILVTAYAVNPYKGSEDGTGWNMITQIARHQKVIAITRKNNRHAIEKYTKENPFEGMEQLQFEYFDLPYWMRFWKKGSRGALLYFYLWQIGLVFFIFSRGLKFDIAHHLNFHSDWMPSFLWIFGKPFVWGPIGHHPLIPKAYIEGAGKKAYYIDRLKWMAKKCFWHCDPFLKITKWKAQKIFTINSSVRPSLNFSAAKEIRLPAVAAKARIKIRAKKRRPTFNILSVGRFVSLKGFDLVISSFAKFYHQQTDSTQAILNLNLIGQGPEKEALMNLAVQLRVDHAIRFIDWMPQSALNHYFRKADVFFFPSHEGAGMVVPEALSYELPILSFDNIGPGEFYTKNCGFKVAYSEPKESVNKFAKYLNFLLHETEVRLSMGSQARKQYENYFTWERKGEVFRNTYSAILKEEQRPMIKFTPPTKIKAAKIDIVY